MEDFFRLVNLVVDAEFAKSNDDDCVLVGEVWNLSKKRQCHLVDNSVPKTWISNSKQQGHKAGYQEPWINNGKQQGPECGYQEPWISNSKQQGPDSGYQESWISNGHYGEQWNNSENPFNGWSNGYMDNRMGEWIRCYRNACGPWIRNGDFLEPWINSTKWKHLQSMLFLSFIYEKRPGTPFILMEFRAFQS